MPLWQRSVWASQAGTDRPRSSQAEQTTVIAVEFGEGIRTPIAGMSTSLAYTLILREYFGPFKLPYI